MLTIQHYSLRLDKGVYMKNINLALMVPLLFLLAGCSEPYEGVFVGEEKGGGRFELSVSNNHFAFKDVELQYKLIDTQDLKNGPLYVFETYDPENSKQAIEGLVISLQMPDKNTIKYGVSQHGLVVTGWLNTLELKRL